MVQDTFVRVRCVKDLAAVVQPRAFLYKTALNLTVDLFRRQRVRSEPMIQLDATEEMPSAMPSQDVEVEAKERVRLLHKAIADLPPKCRQVFLLHKFMDIPHSEIAVRLGISKNMVEKHVMKALSRCREQVEGLGEEGHTNLL